MVVKNSEIKKLETIFEKDRNPLVLMYGSIRSEKEQMIMEFCKNKKSFYFRAGNASPKEQLQSLKAAVEKNFDTKVISDSYDECFKRIKSGDTSTLVVVIDEFQNIAKRDPAFFESILKLKARRLYPGPVMIILMNSSIAWTVNDMVDCLGTDAKKIDHFMKISDLSFLDVVRNFPSFTVKQSVEAYGILGGVPAYLNVWNTKASTKENICSLFLDRHGRLFDEADAFIGSELRELGVYSTILASMARGNEKLNDLFNDTGYSRAKISVYLKNLAAFDVIEKVVSFETGGSQNAKKGVYRIKNHYISFYFRFIYPHLSELYTMTAHEFYDSFIGDQLDSYLRPYFVQVCHEYLTLMNRSGNIPIKVAKMGTWVGKTGTIDIVGQNEARESIVGCCNWDEKELKYETYEELLSTMKQAKIKNPKAVYLFSAQKFDKKLMALAEQDPSLVLVDMTEL